MSTTDAATHIGGLALRALLQELAATPKPGLVDRANSGAHCDMDFYTFLNSATALAPYFTAVAQQGMARYNQPPQELFAAIRPLGVEAEQSMFAATGGINTHKGAVFTLGVLCAAAGVLAARGEPYYAEQLCAYGAEMTSGLCAREYVNLGTKRSLTKGEQLHLQHGRGGVRAEAEAGFPSICGIGYPALRGALLECGMQQNEALLHTLMCLIAEVDDTNVLGRCGVEGAYYAKQCAVYYLVHGGDLSELDADFTAKNISPGGCADLLAASLFVFFLCHGA